MAPDDRPLHLGALLNVRLGEEGADPASTAQGPAPADAASRPAPPVPAPAGEGLSAGEVEALVGSGDGPGGANQDLAQAQNRRVDTGS